ncbi:MAG: histone deacetylase [bacterium]|nr:histone deacetylase [bacterium]
MVRPPGHHARRATAMGFCLFNNVAVTAAMLADRGERVAIVDWDVHHGNATEEMFQAREEILYISLHQYPYYPGTGGLVDMTTDRAAATTLDLPVPAGTAGDLYRLAFAQVIVPVVGGFQPDWLLVSAGYDAHAHDPLAGIRLLASDYAFMADALAAVTPPGRTVYYLEGGYDLEAIQASVSATLAGAAGREVPDEVRRFRSPDVAFRILDAVTGEAAKVWDI